MSVRLPVVVLPGNEVGVGRVFVREGAAVLEGDTAGGVTDTSRMSTQLSVGYL